MDIFEWNFVPQIVFYQAGEEVGKQNYPTTNVSLNEAILPGLLNDKIRFGVPGDIKFEPLDVFHYEFTPSDNLIHIWTQSDFSVTAQQISNIIWDVSDKGVAPDTWFGADLSIVDEDLAHKYGYSGIDLIPHFINVNIMVPLPGTKLYQGYPVDISRLPQHNN